MSPSASTEEYFLAQSLLRKLGSGNIDHRLRQRDFSDDPACPPQPDFGMPIAGIERCDAAVLVGCNPRHEAPIIGHRLRKAWRNGARISVINPVDWSLTFDTELDAIVAPQIMLDELAALAAAVARAASSEPPQALREAVQAARPDGRHEQLAQRLKQAGNGLVLVGQFAMAHENAAWLRALSAYIAEATGSALNVLPHGGNPMGAWRAGALPHRGPGGQPVEGAGRDAAHMLRSALGTYLLWDFEPDFDVDDPAAAMRTLAAADTVIAVAAFAGEGLKAVADVILPLAPHAESEGSLVNYDGLAQSYAAVGKASGEARSGWKILRRLAGELGLEGFGQVDLGEVRADLEAALAAAAPATPAPPEPSARSDGAGLYRAGEVGLYSVDPLCRRSAPLQQTAPAADDHAVLNPADADRLGLSDTDRARVSQGGDAVEIDVRVDERVPVGGVWLRSATGAARALGPAVAPVELEVAG